MMNKSVVKATNSTFNTAQALRLWHDESNDVIELCSCACHQLLPDFDLQDNSRAPTLTWYISASGALSWMVSLTHDPHVAWLSRHDLFTYVIDESVICSTKAATKHFFVAKVKDIKCLAHEIRFDCFIWFNIGWPLRNTGVVGCWTSSVTCLLSTEIAVLLFNCGLMWTGSGVSARGASSRSVFHVLLWRATYFKYKGIDWTSALQPFKPSQFLRLHGSRPWKVLFYHHIMKSDNCSLLGRMWQARSGQWHPISAPSWFQSRQWWGSCTLPFRFSVSKMSCSVWTECHGEVTIARQIYIVSK